MKIVPPPPDNDSFEQHGYRGNPHIEEGGRRGEGAAESEQTSNQKKKRAFPGRHGNRALSWGRVDAGSPASNSRIWRLSGEAFTNLSVLCPASSPS
ncbi:hypothetical protein JOQ06_009777, partial [Pogonophryne albipinna]